MAIPEVAVPERRKQSVTLGQLLATASPFGLRILEKGLGVGGFERCEWHPAIVPVAPFAGPGGSGQE